MAYPVPLIEMQVLVDNIDPAASASSQKLRSSGSA